MNKEFEQAFDQINKPIWPKHEPWVAMLEDEDQPDGMVVFVNKNGYICLCMSREVYEELKTYTAPSSNGLG